MTPPYFAIHDGRIYMKRIARFWKRLPLVAGLLVTVALLGCSAGTRLVDTWQADQLAVRKPDRVAVIVALPDALMRQAIEIDMAAYLEKKGINAVAGSNLQGLGGGIRGEIDTEAATEVLNRNNIDGVIVSFYSGGGREGEYVRDQYYAEYEGTGMGYGWASPYFVDVYSIHRAADINNFTLTVYVETSYYDLESQQAVWRMITQTKDIEHTDTALNIAGKAASQMVAAGLK